MFQGFPLSFSVEQEVKGNFPSIDIDGKTKQKSKDIITLPSVCDIRRNMGVNDFMECCVLSDLST